MSQDLRRGILLGADGTSVFPPPAGAGRADEPSATEDAGGERAPAKKVGMLSLGCPKNLVDGEVMLGQLRARGYDLVADAREADVLVVNTCAFIDRAKQESVDAILEMAALKEQGKAKRLVVTGCLSQRYDAELRREIPEIDASLGTGQVADILRAVEGEATSVGDAPELPTWVYDHTSPRLLTTPAYMAYVKISEGCDYTCSFCIIPTLRGKHRSRSAEDIVAEVRRLAERGVKEVVLVAQDSTRYGLDLGVKDGLAYLLRRLGRIDGLHWIRVMYAYPATLSDPILDAMASEDKVVKYVDIPLQHASESVLKRMKRPTGRGNLLGMVERIRERVPGVAVRTSFIVGFPGETEKDFEELLAFVEAGRFDNVGVFTFSDEEGTTSFDLEGRIPDGVKKRRRNRLMSLQKRLVKKRNRARLGERVEVLVEGLHEDSDLLLVGRTAAQAPEIDGRVILNDGTAAVGDLVAAEITESHDYDFVARIVA
ncbi:MAG TPA: 30S ribosomal protein S12 methylthiotransferase RimO [Vicinamibacteria bacterium]